MTPPLGIIQLISSTDLSDGGPAVGARAINRELNSLGYESVILTLGAAPDSRREGASHTTPDGARIRFFASSRPRQLKHSAGAVRWLLRNAGSYQAVHVHGAYLANSIWALLAKIVCGVKFSLQPHGVFEPYQARNSRFRKGLFDFLIGNRIVRNADFLVAASMSERSNLLSRFPMKSVFVMPLGSDEDAALAPPSEEARELSRWLMSDNLVTYLFLGRFAAKKRPELLVDSWVAAGMKSRLLMVGPEADWTAQDLTIRVPERLRGAFRVAPAVSRQDVAHLLEEADVFVLPSENENFGIAVAEAMYRSCCVITTKQTAASEHVDRARAGIVIDRPEIGQLVDALRLCAMSAEKRLLMKQDAAHYAAVNLTWNSAAKKLCSFYGLVEPRSAADGMPG